MHRTIESTAAKKLSGFTTLICGVLIVLLAFLASAPEASAVAAQPATIEVTVYEGHVDAGSAERFVQAIANSEDKVIGLNVTVEPSGESDLAYGAYLEGDQLSVSSGDPMNAPQGVTINGGVGRTAILLVKADGFYLIKFEGTFAAGAAVWVARPVDEATIRLNPNVRIVRRPF